MATKKIKDLTKEEIAVICKEHLSCQGCPLKEQIGDHKFFHCDILEAYDEHKKHYASIEEFIAKILDQEVEV